MTHDATLCDLSLDAAAQKLGAGDISAEELCKARLARIDAVQPRLFNMARVFHKRALAHARASDARRKAGEARSRFDGVSLTVKESVAMEGTKATLGIPKHKDRTSLADAVSVKLLEDAGCVILGKTNVSQALLFHESRNPLFGEAKNPWNLERTPGGSSGGEAATIACGASPAGIGTDIGGSIRVPAHFCGISGLKPTVDRMSNRGMVAGLAGQETIRGQAGPMGRTVADVRALFSLIGPEASAPLDPRVAPVPLGDVDAVDVSGLKVGVFTDDDVLPTSLACRRAVTQSRAALEARGVTVVDIEPVHADEIVFAYFAAMSADGGDTLASQIEPEDLDKALTVLFRTVRAPRRAKFAAGLALQVAGERTAGRILEVVHKKSVAELWALTARLRELRNDVFDTWRGLGLDAVICPPFATVALPHGMSRELSVAGALSMRFNLLDFPAGSVPVTRVRPDETVRPDVDQKERSGRLLAQVDAGSAGLPVGVQVVAPPFREDRVLALMQAIEDGCKDAKDFPTAPPPRW